MVLFFVEGGLSDEHWEVAVVDALFFEQGVSEGRDLLPDVERRGTQDVAARDVIVLDQLRLGDDLSIPLAEVCFLGELDSSLVHVGSRLDFSGFLLFGLLLRLLLLLRGIRHGWGHFSKVQHFRFMLGQSNDLHHVFLGDGRGRLVSHGVEADELKLLLKAFV